MNYLEYKGYLGTVEFSTEDLVFHGKIHGINDLVTFEATTVDNLISAYHEAVEDYLEICENNEKTPEKSYSGQFNIRIDSSLHRQLSLQAAKEGITLNQCVADALAGYCSENVINYKR